MADTSSSKSSHTRRGQRLKLKRDVTLNWTEGEAQLSEDTSSLSISEFGCAVRSQLNFRPGTRIAVTYRDSVMFGRVIYSLHDYSRGQAEIGIAFEEDASAFWREKF